MSIRVIPLGGLGEFGLNTMVIEAGAERVVMDCGVMFPDPTIGVDYVIPDFRYLLAPDRKISALLITHGHEDHIGAVPFLIEQKPMDIISTPFTLALLKKKFTDLEMPIPEMTEVKPGGRVRIGSIEAEFIAVNHSIPDACAIALHTPFGTIINSGDFKIDQSEYKGERISTERFKELGKKETLLLMSDSTNIEVPGNTPSENTLIASFDEIFKPAKGRIFVGLFASHIRRIQEFVDLAVRYHRKIAFLGRSLTENLALAVELGYISLPTTLIVPPEKISRVKENEIMILATGTQGERGAALPAIAAGENPYVKVSEGDILVHSARIIPGNELSTGHMFDGFYKQGAKVIESSDKLIHISGHGGQEDQKLLINLIKPKYFIPIHGNYRLLAKHADLAKDAGVPEQHIFVMENGDCLEIKNDKALVTKLLKIEKNFVEGGIHEGISGALIRTRRQLARGGVVIVVIIKEESTASIVTGPHIICKGVTDSEDLIEEMKNVASDSLSATTHEFSDPHDEIRVAIRRLLEKRISKRPLVVPIILEV
ncbi:MAG: hypothetical protein A3F16_01205 [Deltaproteobacteria bacterium RIFCSPHIGHO2_12_FULL_43_9]|nr:MAG: hypothetical protein A3F16_01205 [Deltaproteobacteria bacterium RIFCSPHIGHO2_12_FULL_43_9]